MRHTSAFARGLAGVTLAAALFIVAGSVAEADKNNQKGNGKKVPEVPVAALLPAASGIIGAGYYLVHRIRNRRSDDQ